MKKASVLMITFLARMIGNALFPHRYRLVFTDRLARYAFNTGPELETKRDVQDGAPYVYEDAQTEAVPLEARGFPAPASGHHGAHKHGHQHNKRFWNW